MGAVAGLDRDIELGALGRHIEKQPAVIDLQDVDAELPEPGRDLPEHAGPVRDRQAERDDALVALELAHHDRSENARIDIAAAQDRGRPCGRETARASTSMAASPAAPGAFRHGLLQREIGVDRALEDCLVDQHDLGRRARARSAA